jgi:hypothetical protein
MEYARAARCLKILLQPLRHRSLMPAMTLAAFLLFIFCFFLLIYYDHTWQ